jgi:AraC-like DNA-binding protein
VLVWPKIRGDGTPTPTPTGNRSATSPTAAAQGGVTRTPRLGLEFWQSGKLAPMTFDAQGTQDIVNVTMQKAPFEFRFPKQATNVAIQVCAWTDSSIFTLTDRGDANTSPSFKTGTGIADYEYGSGTLYLNNEGNNYLINTRIAHQSIYQDKAYFAQVYQNHAGKPLQQWTGNIYLAVWIDKNQNHQFNLTGPAEYEFVVLHF